MSLLAAMKQKKKERLTVKHPLYQRDISMRYAYVMGVALVAATGGGISETGRAEMEKLVYAIGLPEDTLEKVIATAEAAEAESIDTVVDTVLEKEEQYCLLLEMHLAALRSGAEQQREQQELISGFGELMLLSADEDKFLRKFAQAAQEKNTSMATDIMTEGYRNNLEPSFEVLKYFLPTLDYREEIEGFTLEAGQSRSITRPCVVKGPIVVKEGALLSVQGISMSFGLDGGIVSKGGKLQLCDSSFIAMEGCRPAMLEFENMPLLTLENVCFDGQKQARAIRAKGGMLEANTCNFENCYGLVGKNGGAIYASQCNLSFSNASFKNCYAPEDGGAIYVDNAVVDLKNCTFERCQSCCGGGAFFLYTSANILKCQFFECEAKSSGGGIWFALKACKIDGSRFEKCSAGLQAGGVYGDGIESGTMICRSTFIECITNSSVGGGGIHFSQITDKTKRKLSDLVSSYSYCLTDGDGAVEKCTYEGCKPYEIVCE